MTLPSLTCSKLARLALTMALGSVLHGATVSGQIELSNSRDSAVKRDRDYSGVVIWLEPVNEPAHCTPARHAQILQKDKKFTPHILPVCLGTTVSFPNLDPIFHNAFSNFNGKVFDIGLHPPGSSPSTKFDRPGIVRVFCNIHHSMSAVIVVLDTPYFAETDKRGKYSIPDVPAGEYQLHAFHERTTPENLARLTRKVSVEQQAVEEPLIAISETGYLPVPHKNKYGREYAIRNDEDRPGYSVSPE
jgi:plastocyanin